MRDHGYIERRKWVLALQAITPIDRMEWYDFAMLYALCVLIVANLLMAAN